LKFIKRRGAVPGIQLAHAGRKASANRPWEGDDHIPPNDPRAWEPLGPSPMAFGGNLPRVPHEMAKDEILRVQGDFVAAAKRALAVGYEWLELHYAHGYLAQSFFSPIANKRTDEYGGSFENRARFLLDTLNAVRAVWPEKYPLTIRLGVSDFTQESQPLEEAIELVKKFKQHGLDLIDVSLGFNTPDVSGVPWGPAFLAPVAQRIREEAAIATAVGWFINEPQQAEEIIAKGQADLVMLAHKELDDPHFPYHAAKALGLDKRKKAIVLSQATSFLSNSNDIALSSPHSAPAQPKSRGIEDDSIPRFDFVFDFALSSPRCAGPPASLFTRLLPSRRSRG
jgi:2,4-dienoyl-CoA reductase-like NADH-dependent reductase (Old Yellow Enzyme family)